MAENAGSVTLTVQRTGSGAACGRALVNYKAIKGTAAPDLDFQAVQGQLTWTVGDTTPRSIVVPIVDDTKLERAETFSVLLQEPVNSTAGTPSTVTVSITDDD